MHTDASLDIFSQATTSLGNSLQNFQDKTCTMFQTRELERERDARRRRQENKTAKCGARPRPPTPSNTSTAEPMVAGTQGAGPIPASSFSNSKGEPTVAVNHRTGPTPAGVFGTEESTNAEEQESIPTPASSSSSTQVAANATDHSSGPTLKAPKKNARKPKSLNLDTYTYHALGDYVTTIRQFGTTDSYSTQPVSLWLVPWRRSLMLLIIHGRQSELEHRTSKARFRRTNGRLIPLQLSQIERRQRQIRTIREKLCHPSQRTNEEDVTNDPKAQYNIGKTRNAPVHVPTFVQKNDGDPAVKVGSFILSYCFRVPT
jgi:hypothetical protein